VPGRRFAFVLKLWTETSEGTSSPRYTLRGSVQAVDSDQVRYFQALDKIPEILQEITGWQDTHKTNQGRKE
jgi:hypothetical protein